MKKGKDLFNEYLKLNPLISNNDIIKNGRNTAYDLMKTLIEKNITER